VKGTSIPRDHATSASGLIALAASLACAPAVKAQDASQYYTVLHPEQFQTDWAGFYRDVDARTAAVRTEFPHHLDLPYGADIKQRLDLYLPRNKVAHAATLLFLHGGGFREGDRAQYGYIAKPFIEQGILVAVASYRLTDPGFRYPDQVEDVKLAVRWIYQHIAHYGGSDMRIFVGGHSAGAILAADIGVDRSWMRKSGIPARALQGIAPVSALYDLRVPDPNALKKVFWNVYAPTIEIQESASPLLRVRDPAPAAVVGVGALEQHGAEDFVAGSTALVEKLNGAGSSARLVSLSGMGHKEAVLALGDGQSEIALAIIRMIKGSEQIPPR
jgi:acetyl esterase/lipase